MPLQATHAWGVEEEEGREQGGESPQPSSDDDEEDEPRNPLQEDKEPPQWRPGEVAVIEQGGRDVQSVLDGDGLRMGVIDWHASWIEACLDVEPFLKRWEL